MVGFESIFEKRLRLGKLCNGSHLYKNSYNVLDFLKIFHVLKVFGVCFESVWCLFYKDVCFESEQATKNVSTYSKFFCLFLISFDISILPWIGKKPYLWM